MRDFMFNMGLACAVVGLTLSVWTLWDEIKRRKKK